MPILDAHSLEFFSRSPEQTRRIGLRLGSLLQAGDVIGLQGDLGTGKTTLVRGLAQGWGAVDAVSSPTFVLVNVYRRADQKPFFHMDAYRLNSLAEAEELDLTTMLEAGPVIIEWAERVAPLLPSERLWVTLEHAGEEHRRLLFVAGGARYDALLQTLRHSLLGGIS